LDVKADAKNGVYTNTAYAVANSIASNNSSSSFIVGNEVVVPSEPTQQQVSTPDSGTVSSTSSTPSTPGATSTSNKIAKSSGQVSSANLLTDLLDINPALAASQYDDVFSSESPNATGDTGQANNREFLILVAVVTLGLIYAVVSNYTRKSISQS
jgi:hypothetical protein